MTMLSRMNQLRKNKKGFTLVEVIVVAVIVAVLALVAILLYQGYAKDARRNTAENLAASAAGYLQAERNRGSTIAGQTVTGPDSLVVGKTTENTKTTFVVPNGSKVVVTGTEGTGGTVNATVGLNAAGTGGEISKDYSW